jgi:hypothetical protein
MRPNFIKRELTMKFYKTTDLLRLTRLYVSAYHEAGGVIDAILLAPETFKGSNDWKKDGGAFICAPLVWLNNRRWEDA